jgi:hypothetical protein
MLLKWGNLGLKSGGMDKPRKAVILPGCPFHIYQKAESFIERKFINPIVVHLLPIGSGHGGQLHFVEP